MDPYRLLDSTARVKFTALWVAALALLWLPTGSLRAAELVMFELPGCEWCARWDADVGVIYPKTAEGRTAPLRRVFMHKAPPDDLRYIEAVRYSPTFVLVDEGREVGRILGYPGEDHFWGLLGGLLERMAQNQQSVAFCATRDDGDRKATQTFGNPIAALVQSTQ